MTSGQRVGFVGVGRMGHGLALNIARAGYTLMFYEHPGNQPVADLYEHGAASSSNLAEVARHADIVVLCITGSAQVQEVITGPDGILAEIKPGTIVVDCSTVEPHVTLLIAEAVHDSGAKFVDAPLTRTPKEAELGMANVMVGGDSDTLEMIRPLLATFSENIYHAGPTGAGATLKLLHNFISLGNCVLLSEAIVSARKSQVDMDTLIEVLTTGGGDSTALRRLTPFIREGDVGSFRFSIANSAKDLSYYRNLAEHIGVPRLAAEAVFKTFEQARSAGNEDEPVPALIDVMWGAASERDSD